MSRLSANPLLAVLVAALVLGACKKDEITHFRVSKPAPADPAKAAAAAPAMPAAMAGDVPPPPAPTGDQALAWTLPQGWTEARGGGGMRLATLRAPNSAVDVSIIVLSGEAGGELANVNRWRGQIGLPPLDGQGLATSREVATAPVGPVAVFDFTSDATKSRVVGGIASSAGNTWFFKLSGDAASVGAAKPDFLRLLGSLRR